MSQVDDEVARRAQESGEAPIIAEKKTATRHISGFPAFLRNPRAQGWLVGLLVFGVALGFATFRLGAPSIWFDEAFSVELARQPLPLLWHIIWGPEPNMELYYLFLHGWLGLTGFFGWLPTELVVRLPSAIFAAFSSVVVYFLGRRFLGMAAGITAAGLYSFNYLQLIYAQQARSYSLQLLLICIAWYALFAVLATSGHSKRWWVCYGLTMVLAIYAHLFSGLILAAQVLAYAGLLMLPGPWRVQARRQLRWFIVTLFAMGACCIPMLLVSLHGAKTGWLPVPQPRDIVALFQYITTNSALYLFLLFLLCFFAVCIALLTVLPEGNSVLQLVTFSSGKDARDEARLHRYFPVAFALVCWLLVPVIASYLISQGSVRLFSSRYLVTILPPLFLLAGMTIAALRWRAVQVGLIVGLFLIALYYVPVYYRSAQVEDWNSAVPWLEQRYQPGDGLVCFDNDVEQGCQIAVQYYLDAYPSAAHFTPDTPGAFSWQTFGPANPSSGPFAAVDPQALAAYAAQHPRLFYILGRIPDQSAAEKAQAAQTWLDQHYHLLARIHTPTVTISLYATGV